jgi:hypothetical protein
MDLHYAWENLFKAVHGAIQSESSLQDRLHGCYGDFHVLSHHGHLPPDLQERWDKMMKAWTRGPDTTGQGLVPATLQKMDDDEARKWLEEILSLYSEVVRRRALEK